MNFRIGKKRCLLLLPPFHFVFSYFFLGISHIDVYLKDDFPKLSSLILKWKLIKEVTYKYIRGEVSNSNGFHMNLLNDAPLKYEFKTANFCTVCPNNVYFLFKKKNTLYRIPCPTKFISTMFRIYHFCCK